MGKIRILIVDDHALVRSGVRALLEAQPDMEVVGEAEDGTVVERLGLEVFPDVVLLDLTMPGRGGIAAAADLRRSCPHLRILVLTMHEEEAYVRLAAASGAAGYVSKRGLATELVAAIRMVHAGGRYAPPDLAAAFDDTSSGATPERRESGLDRLTEREREVTGLVALGFTNAEIAEQLHISPKTVETHRAHVLSKLGLRTRADLVRFALEHGLVRP
jgi:two-component system response regulator NreC